MSDSICRFLPAKDYAGNIKAVHFVYETDFHQMKQPFLKPIYYMHLVTSGSATMRFVGRCEHICAGSLFLFLPGIPYEIEASEDFRYIYISFMGSGAPMLLENLEIGPDRSVFSDFAHISDFWMSSISRVNNKNANILAESVLFYTLSFLTEAPNEQKHRKSNEDAFEMIVDYVDMHYRDTEITLKRVADVFSYTEKYLSHLFKKKMNIGFNKYLNSLRLRYAHKLISEGAGSISDIALQCGYGDPLYFSKVFKKHVGYSPSDYMARKENGADI